LVTLPEVQRALKLAARQKRGVAKINQDMIDGRRKLFQAGVGGIGGGIQKLGEDAADKLAKLLDDEQEKRLRGITIQIAGANAVMIDAVLAKELKITDDQKSKLQEIQQANMREMSETFQASGIPPENSRAKFEELHANGQKKLLAVLTTEQQKQLDSLQGDKIEIDLMKLPGGGSGDRRRGGR
jgi:Spy/CpxP family protein refolding chaperone